MYGPDLEDAFAAREWVLLGIAIAALIGLVVVCALVLA